MQGNKVKCDSPHRSVKEEKKTISIKIVYSRKEPFLFFSILRLFYFTFLKKLF